MRDYSKVSPQFWVGHTGRQIRKLGVETQLIALYLLTCPHANMIGIYYLPLAYISHDTGIPIEGASKALRSLNNINFCRYDEHSEFIWIYEMALFQIGEQLDHKDKRVKGINESYASLPNLPFLKDFYEKYHASFHLENARENSKTIYPLEVPSKGLPSQEQEQEQYQDKEQEQKQEEECEEEEITSAASVCATSLRDAAPPDSLIILPLKNHDEFFIDASMIAEWQILFPSIDVLQELRHIRSWNLANPQRRKTKRGILRHIQGWLLKEQSKRDQPYQYSTSHNHRTLLNYNQEIAHQWLNQQSTFEGEINDERSR